MNQFGNARPTGSFLCAECEAMLADVLDGVLDAVDQARFDRHVEGCATCSQMLADARRGAAWLEMLRDPRPEPPAALLERILIQISGTQTSGLHADSTLLAPVAAPHTATVLPFCSKSRPWFHPLSIGQVLREPRLMMTAAMAFFSVGLTLNLAGVQLNQLRPADLRPSSVRRNFYQANAHVVRYVENLRAVYELESRVRDLQRASGDDSPDIPHAGQPNPTPDAPGNTAPEPPKPQPLPQSGPGASLRPIPRPIPVDPRHTASLRLADLSAAPHRELGKGGLL